MTRDQIEQCLEDHQAGFLARDPDALADTHAPDGTFESPAHGLVQGREAIRGIYRYWYEAFPDFMLMWSAPIIEPPRAALFWKFDGTTSGHEHQDERCRRVRLRRARHRLGPPHLRLLAGPGRRRRHENQADIVSERGTVPLSGGHKGDSPPFGPPAASST
jgi:hypothetical protein